MIFFCKRSFTHRRRVGGNKVVRGGERVRDRIRRERGNDREHGHWTGTGQGQSKVRGKGHGLEPYNIHYPVSMLNRK